MRTADGPSAKMSIGVTDQEKNNALAKSSPGCKTFTEEWAIVDVLVYSFHAVEDGIVDFGVTLALELDGRWGSARPLVKDIAILTVCI